MEGPCRALGQPSSEGLDRSADVIDQLRAGTHQRLPGADDGQVSLGVFAPMFEWVQQLRVHSCQASEVLSVDLIRFTLVSVDEPQLPGVGHQHLVAALLKHPARPGRVGTGLDCYAHRRPLGGEASSEGLWGCAQPTLLYNLAAL